MWQLITFMAGMFVLAACTEIYVSGEGHNVTTSAEMHTGSSNEAKSEVTTEDDAK